jgi:hypothetical protein
MSCTTTHLFNLIYSCKKLGAGWSSLLCPAQPRTLLTLFNLCRKLGAGWSSPLCPAPPRTLLTSFTQEESWAQAGHPLYVLHHYAPFQPNLSHAEKLGAGWSSSSYPAPQHNFLTLLNSCREAWCRLVILFISCTTTHLFNPFKLM